MQKTIIILLTALIVTSCASVHQDSEVEWVDTGRETNPNYADVVWFTGTLFDNAIYDDANTDEYRIRQTADEQPYYTQCTLWARDNLFPDSLNFFAPFYHQFTFSSLTLPPADFDSLCEVIYDEAYASFQYYMDHFNQGRPYVLAGMSQGAMVVQGILKRMSDDEYSRLVAAYSLGYGLSAESLACSHIRPAQRATDHGVTISFNSVASREGIWPFVYNNTQAVINPVSWSTDTATATFVALSDTVSVRIDSDLKVLMVSGWTHHDTVQMEGKWVNDNLHLEDLIMYAPLIRRNVLDRVASK